MSRRSACFSAPALLFAAFGTRHTFYADRAAAFLKYLRFSREIDWNNFSHTDSSPELLLLPLAEAERRW